MIIWDTPCDNADTINIDISGNNSNNNKKNTSHNDNEENNPGTNFATISGLMDGPLH